MQNLGNLEVDIGSLGLNTPRHMEGIQTLRDLLGQVTVADNEVQKNVSRTLAQLSELPEFPVYCSLLILDERTGASPAEQSLNLTIRYTAGICLKSVLTKGNFHPQTAAEHKNFMENSVFKCWSDGQPELIRRAGKLNLVALVGRQGLLNSERILQFLVECINSGKTNLEADALESLALIFQDMNMNSENIEDPDRIFSSTFVEELVKKLLQVLEPNNAVEVRIPAFDCLTTLLIATPACLMQRLPVIVTGMVQMLGTPDAAAQPTIRDRIYTFFSGLVQIQKDVFAKFVDQVFPVIITGIHDSDLKVRRAALMIVWEWLTVQDGEDRIQSVARIKDYLPTLIPGLIDNMILTEEDKDNMMSATRVYLEKNTILEKGISGFEEDDGLNPLQEDDDDDMEDQAEVMGSYTRRKLALRSIHNIYQSIGFEGFSIMKSKIDDMLQSQNDLLKEAAVSVLGTVGEYIFLAIKAHIGPLLVFIRENTTSSNEFLACASIWTIGKFRKDIMKDASNETRTFLIGFLEILAQLLQSDRILVQDAAAATLRKFCKDDFNGAVLENFYPKLIDHFSVLLQPTNPNKVFLMDTLAELAHTIQNDRETVNALLVKTMPQLADMFDNCPMFSGEFATLFESINSLASTAGEMFLPWARQTMVRALTIGRDVTLLLRRESNTHSSKKKSKDRVIYENELNYQLMRCLDFIATVCFALKEKIVSLDLSPALVELILENLTSPNVMVKQVIYSTLGDLIPMLDPRLFEANAKQIFDILLEDCKTIPVNLDSGRIYTSLAANALYAIGEVISRFPQVVDLQGVLKKLQKLYEFSKLHKVLSTNASLVYGKLALRYPTECSAWLEPWLKKICYGFIINASAAAENSTIEAVQGLNAAIIAKPSAVLGELGFYLELAGQLENLPPQASEGISKILRELSQGGPEISSKVQTALTVISSNAKRVLRQKYAFGS